MCFELNFTFTIYIPGGKPHNKNGKDRVNMLPDIKKKFLSFCLMMVKLYYSQLHYKYKTK